MNILFQLDYPSGLGADRWIVEGYRSAFEDLGHPSALISERDDPQGVWAHFRPDIFMTSTNIARYGKSFLAMLQAYRRTHSCAVLFHIGEDFAEHRALISRLCEERLVDVWYSYYAREVMMGFEQDFGVQLHRIPLAADAARYFPVTPDPRFAADISFVGARLPTKEHLFQTVLLPLAERYRVRIYGSGWTIGDRTLRFLRKTARAARAFPFVEWIDKRRLTLQPADERVVYASAKICINIHEYSPEGRCKNLSNEREFKIPACGGFQLSDRVVGIEDCFLPGQEIAIVDEPTAWISAVERYLANPGLRRVIQERGTARVHREHTYHHRARHILALCRTA